MSLPHFSTQGELFSTAGLSGGLFAETDRYRLFAKLVYPPLVRARAKLEKCYCADNGRVALEPVLLLGVSILQDLDGVPDRQAVEMLRYHAGWNFALNRQLGDEVFHATSLVNFRHRLLKQEQSALGFATILEALIEAGLVSRQSRQRLDSTPMFARVARMSRLDCVRESLRLALRELEAVVGVEARPEFWVRLWERYVESQADYRASAEALGRKLGEAGADAWQLLEWVRGPERGAWAQGAQVQLLARVFGEQFDVVGGQPTALAQEKEVVEAQGPPTPQPASEAGAVSEACPGSEAGAGAQPELGLAAAVVVPKGKGQLASDRVQNPHDAEATYAVKGQGAQKKEHIGFKIQVAETVSEAVLAPGEPTRDFLTGIVTHRAHESDEVGEAKMEQCHDCPLRERCLGEGQRHRTLVVGEHHTLRQSRRQEQQTEAFQQRMKQRNAIEGTQSELVRGHGMRHARYRGLAKARLQNYFIGAACNVKRWIRHEAWKLRKAAAALAAAVSADAAAVSATPVN